MGLRSVLMPIPYLGGLKLPTRKNTAGLDTFGQAEHHSMRSRDLLTSRFSFFWATKPISWDLEAGRGNNGAEVGRALTSQLS